MDRLLGTLTCLSCTRFCRGSTERGEKYSELDGGFLKSGMFLGGSHKQDCSKYWGPLILRNYQI